MTPTTILIFVAAGTISGFFAGIFAEKVTHRHAQHQRELQVMKILEMTRPEGQKAPTVKQSLRIIRGNQ